VSDDFLEKLRNAGAIWEWEEGAPHAITPSGLHTDFYFHSPVLSARPGLLKWFCKEFFLPLLSEYGISPEIVATYPPHSLPFATLLGELLHTGVVYPLTSDGAEIPIETQGVVLVVADDLVTGASLRRLIQLLRRRRCSVAPIALCFGNLSEMEKVEGVKIVSVFKRPVKNRQVDQCSLCLTGSEPLSVLTDWHRLG
jgi:orotate phosphoribosyltransferase